MYWGHCANCGADPQSLRMRNTRRTHPRGRSIPSHITHRLPHQSEENNKLCTTCYHQLIPRPSSREANAGPSSVSALDTLASAAADVQPSPSVISAVEAPLQALPLILPQSPALQILSPSINNISHHSQPLQPISHAVSAPSILQPARRILVDISNTLPTSAQVSSKTTAAVSTLRKKRHSISIKEKENIVKEWDTETATNKRQEFLQTIGKTTSDINKYKRLIQERNETPKKERTPKKYKRTRGAGPPTVLSDIEEKEIYDWIMKSRVDALRVTEKDIKRYAKSQYDIRAGNSWLDGFMNRHDLSTRLRTTHKYVVDNVLIQHTASQYRLDRKDKTFPLFQPACSWNMDETGIYLDSVGNRTVDKKGAKVVCIKGTKGEKDRVTCVICVSAIGKSMELLMIHKATGKEKRNTIYIRNVSYIDRNSIKRHKRIYVTYTAKTIITERIMAAWLRYLFYPHAVREAAINNTDAKIVLFLDNASPHRTEAVDKVFQELNIRHEYFPANCTPLVQPLDFNLNNLFKRAYEDEWNKWYKEVGRFKKNKNGNQAKPSQAEVNSWCAAAIDTICADVIIKSWNHCLTGDAVLEESMKLCNEKGNMIIKEEEISKANNRWAKQPLNSLSISGELILQDETVSVAGAPVMITPAIVITCSNNSNTDSKADGDETEEDDAYDESDDKDDDNVEVNDDDTDDGDNSNEEVVAIVEEENDDDDDDDDWRERKYDDEADH
jgi:hypothetical protein